MAKEYGGPVFGMVTSPLPVAQTTHGKIFGENRDGVAVFRGIPYGDDCGGGNRWLPPRPARDWPGIRDCAHNGHIAWQSGPGSASGIAVYWNGGHPEKFGAAQETKSEDCLVLNVVTPGLDDGKRPVAVYFHGGGYASGSGTLVLGADPWAREQDIVIVGVNHRLNAFGYLYLGAVDPRYEASGMAGMLDLVLALEWVRDNIRAFGGDPDKVTIMGESGGGGKVSTLLEMPKARGLFRAAIVESGSFPVGALSREDAAKTARALIERLEARTLDDLIQTPPERLVAATEGMRLSPVADGVHLQPNPTGAFRAPAIDVPVLVGFSEDEAGVFFPKEELEFGWDELRERLLHGDRWTSGFTEENVDRCIALFRAENRKGDDAARTFLKMLSLPVFGKAFDQAMCLAQANRSPVFHYVIAYDSPYPAQKRLMEMNPVIAPWSITAMGRYPPVCRKR